MMYWKEGLEFTVQFTSLTDKACLGRDTWHYTVMEWIYDPSVSLGIETHVRISNTEIHATQSSFRRTRSRYKHKAGTCNLALLSEPH